MPEIVAVLAIAIGWGLPLAFGIWVVVTLGRIRRAVERIEARVAPPDASPPG